MKGSLLAGLALLALAACGGETGPNGDGDGFMRATINGEDWESDPTFVNLGVQAPTAGIFVISGAEVSGSEARSITISLSNIAAPGTYPLGVGGTVRGGSGVLTDAGEGWGTALSGAAGSITITTLSASRMVGTFEFTAEPSVGGASGARTVSNGEFDLAVDAPGGSLPVLAANAGNEADGSVGGAPFTAATVVSLLTATDILSVGVSNTSYSISATVGDMTGPGTYDLTTVPPVRGVAVTGPPQAPDQNCCWPLGAGQSGSITIATMTADRITGSVSATIPPQAGSGATGPLTVELEFDIGRP